MYTYVCYIYIYIYSKIELFIQNILISAIKEQYQLFWLCRYQHCHESDIYAVQKCQKFPYIERYLPTGYNDASYTFDFYNSSYKNCQAFCKIWILCPWEEKKKYPAWPCYPLMYLWIMCYVKQVLKHKPNWNVLMKYKVYFLNLCLFFAGQHIGAAISDWVHSNHNSYSWSPSSAHKIPECMVKAQSWPLLSNSKVKNAWSYTSIPHLHGMELN
jgi:hypothetical protein